jgi:diguanylate cyclase (GGDEF)-like protein
MIDSGAGRNLMLSNRRNMQEPGSVSAVQPGPWQRLLAGIFGPPLFQTLRHEYTRQLGSYLFPFLISGLVAASLSVFVAVSVRSTLAMFFAGIGLAGFGFIVMACREARQERDPEQMDETESRFALGASIVAIGLGGIVVAVLGTNSPLLAQAMVVMVALAALGGSSGAWQGRPELALVQATCIGLPTATALLLRWPTPWGAGMAVGVLTYAIVSIAIARHSFRAQSALLRAREEQRGERNRMRVALEHLGQAIAVLDTDLKVTLINRSALDLLGMDNFDPAQTPRFDDLLASAPNLVRASGNREEFLAHAELLVTARQPFSGVLRLNDDRMIDLECLPITDGGWVAMMRDATGERHAIAELNREIRRCPLTGLPNRRGFLEELDRRLSRGDHFALMIIDLDGFKQVNDRHGHSVGDRMITRIGFRLRTADQALYAARLGGDEFAVLAEIDSADEAVALARRLVDTIDVPARFGEAEVQVGAAIGVALAPDDGVLAETLLRAADLALLTGKAQPGNQIRLFTPDLLERSARIANLEARVRSALRGGRVDVAYQPQVDLKSGKVVALEALARWRDDGGEPVEPHQLVAIAENRGLIGDLRRMVLDQAAATVASLDRPLDLWVNISVHDLRQPGMVGEISAALAAAGLPPARLAVEVTETALMTSEDSCQANLQALHLLGVAVAMDDFGAGFASLDRLRRMPVDALKISGSLLHGAAEDRLAGDIFSMAANLGRAMKLMLVAEAVQGAAELALARAAGIDRAQGFALSAAVPAEQIEAAIAAAEAAARPRRARPAAKSMRAQAAAGKAGPKPPARQAGAAKSKEPARQAAVARARDKQGKTAAKKAAARPVAVPNADSARLNGPAAPASGGKPRRKPAAEGGTTVPSRIEQVPGAAANPIPGPTASAAPSNVSPINLRQGAGGRRKPVRA